MEDSTTVDEEGADGGREHAEHEGGSSVPMTVRSSLGLLLVAIFAGLLWLDSLWRPGYVLVALAVPVIALTTCEFCHLTDPKKDYVPRLWTVLAAVALFVLQWAGWAFEPFPGPWVAAVGVLSLGVCLLFTWRIVSGSIAGTQEAVSLSLTAWIYVPLLLSFLAGVRVRWGVAGVIVALAVCKISDSTAYFVGKTLGRRKLAPRISPNKTIEGAVGAVIGSTVAAVALNMASPWALMPLWPAVGYGVALGIVAIIGDLAGSILKRQSGVKDSGELLRGFGGMLDIVDDVLFAAPLSYVFFHFFAG